MQASTEVLLLHDDQLADVAALLSELEVKWDEESSARGTPEVTGLVIGTPLHLLKWKTPGDPRAVARVALCDGGGRIMEKRLEADGVDFVLRRPIHPTALRLLVQHMIYKGPERRRLRRVDAALPLRFRAGWKAQSGLLLEFSVGGCSVLANQPLAPGKAIKVFMPAEIGQGRELGVKASVVRCHDAPEGKPGEHVVAMRFDDLRTDTHQLLAAAVAARAGRAARAAAPPSPREDRAAVAPSTRQPTPTDEPVSPAESPASATPAVAGRLATGPMERRRAPRAVYPKKVHGRIGSEPVVLMGSDLSVKGMQVKPDPRLAVGLCLKLDLYGRGDIPPIQLDARVARSDGERGLFLEFQNLWPGAPALLERLIKTLPLLEPGTRDRMVITEVIEHR